MQLPPRLRAISLSAWLMLGIVLVLAAWLRWHDFNESLWLDELHSAWCVNGDLSDVAPRAIEGNQSPVPYWLLWCWVQVAGENEWTLRGPSLLASLLAIVLVFVALKRWTGSYAAGLVAALALAIEPSSIFYGSEVRVYASVQLLAVIHMLLFVELLTRGVSEDARDIPSSLTLRIGVHVAWVLVGALLFYMHYTAALLLVAEAVILSVVFCVGRIQRDGENPLAPYANNVRSSFRYYSLDVAALIVLCLPALGPLMQVGRRRGNWALFIEQPSLLGLWEAIPHRQALGNLLLLIAIVHLYRWATKRTPRLLTPVSLTGATVMLWFLVPLLLSWLLSITEVARLFNVRYFVICLPAFACVLGWLVSLLPTPLLRCAALPIIFALLLTRGPLLAEYVIDPEERHRRNEGWREAVMWINNDSESDKILLAPGLIEGDALRITDDPFLREYLCYPLRSLYEIERPVTIEPLPMTDPWRLTDEQLRAYEHPHVILIIRGPEKYREDVQKRMLEAMIHPKYHIFEEASFGDVGVYRLTVWPWSAVHVLDDETRARLHKVFPDDSYYRPRQNFGNFRDRPPADDP